MSNKKKYTFVRIKDKTDDVGQGQWYLKADSQETIMEHWLQYCKHDISEGVKEVFDMRILGYIHKKHYTTQFGSMVELKLQMEGGNPIQKAHEFEAEILQSRLNSFREGYEQYLSKGLTVFMIDERFYEIVETVESDEMIYPEDLTISLDQVKYSQWTGYDGLNGTHWYAKVGKIDIVDEQGRQKWDTREEAEEAARKFVEEYNFERTVKTLTRERK